MSSPQVTELAPARGRSSSAPAAERTLALLPWALLGVFIVLAWLGRAPGVLTRQDDAEYIVLSRALRMGTYRDFMWPGAPWHHFYPAGYPALLALWTTLGGERFDWLVVLQITLSAASLGFAFDAARRVYSRPIALGGLAMLSVSPWYLDWAGQVASEGALALCFSVAVWASVAREGRSQTAIIVTAAIVAPLMRAPGLTLPVAVFAVWVWERRFRDVAVLVAIALPVLGALALWTMADPAPQPGASYAGDVKLAVAAPSRHVMTLLSRVFSNVEYYISRGFPALFAVPTIEGTMVDNVVGAGVLGLGLLAGTLRGFWRFRMSTALVIVTTGLLLLWPYKDARFWVPVLPLIVFVFLDGVAAVMSLLRTAHARTVVLGVVLILTVSGFAMDVGHLRSARGCMRGQPVPGESCLSPDQASFFRAARFIGDSMPPAERVLSARSVTLFLYSNHLTAPLGWWSYRDPSTFWTELGKQGTSYVLLSGLDFSEPRYLAPRLVSGCSALDVIRSYPPRTYLLKVARRPDPASQDTTAAATGAACVALRQYLLTHDIR